jgi:hypothetical protein
LADNNVYTVTASSITSIDPSAFSAVFVALGYYPDNHIISSAESSNLVAYLNAGGSLYIEGGDTWYYDPPQSIRDAMGIRGIADSGGTLTTINGLTGTITQGLSFEFEGTQGWADSIDVAVGVTDGARIWQNASPEFYAGVSRNTGTYRSIGCSYEFGNIPAAQRNAVMAVYLGFMIVRPPSQSASPPDFDGDGKTDIVVYRPSSGIWYSRLSGTPGSFKSAQWGESGDVPVAADYDGDGQSDLAVFRPSSGVWYILSSSVPGNYTAIAWGMNQDIPVPGDYDGDGMADIAVFRPSSGIWYVQLSGTPGSYVARQWGMNGDIPVPGDYDADGKTDFAVWRPSPGIWYALSSSNPNNYTSTQWGMNGDIPTPGDFDADGKTDMTVFRPSTGIWYSLSSGTPGSYTSIPWGTADDVPTPGDYDGDGKADIAIWRPGTATWYVRPSSSPASYTTTQWGLADDIAVSPITGILFFIP